MSLSDPPTPVSLVAEETGNPKETIRTDLISYTVREKDFGTDLDAAKLYAQQVADEEAGD